MLLTTVMPLKSLFFLSFCSSVGSFLLYQRLEVYSERCLIELQLGVLPVFAFVKVLMCLPVALLGVRERFVPPFLLVALLF